MRKTPTKQKVKIPGSNRRRPGFKGSNDNWVNEIKGQGLNEQAAAAIAAMPRIESRSSQNTELLARLREENSDKVKGSRLPDQLFMLRLEKQRRGRPMHHIQFLKKLRGAGIRAWLNPVPTQGLVGLRAERRGFEQLGIQFVCAVKLGWTTEYDVFHYDAHGVELNKKFIGWRSVILQLIAKGIISQSEAHKIFGSPALNEGSSLYRQSLWVARNDHGK